MTRSPEIPRVRAVVLALGLGAATGGVVAPACGDPLDGSDCGPTRALVVRVIDGDTVELEGGERLRYLMVDTPEISGGSPECYGPEAAEFNRQLVEAKEVTIRYDVECTDRYDRLLGYVEIDGRSVNRLLVERGLACVLRIPPNGEEVADEFASLEAAARARMVGMWGSCEDVPCD
jgi:micrococcal nuclease